MRGGEPGDEANVLYSHRIPPLSGGEVWELIRSLCPDPGMKFILPCHCQLTGTTNSWDNAFSAVTGAYRSAATSTIAETGIVSLDYMYYVYTLTVVCLYHIT